MTRVAVVTTSYPEHDGDPSGHFVRAEVRALERRGCDVHVFAARGPAFGWPGVLPRLRARPAAAFSGARELARLRRELVRGGPWDRIVAHWLPTALVAAGAEGPLTVVAHGSDVRVLAALPAPLRSVALRALLTRASEIRVVSATLADALVACASGHARDDLAARIRVEAPPLELDVDRDALRADSKRLRAAHGSARRVAVTVARLIATKRVDRVLDRIAAAPEPTTLFVIGDGPERERLEAHARALAVDARFLGRLPRPETLAWIGAADVLLHASEAEGLSTVLREAEALGTRVDAF